MENFKVGDRVRHKKSGRIDIVALVPGMIEYDSYSYSDAEKGFRLRSEGWDYQDYWEPVSEVEDTIDCLRYTSSFGPSAFSRGLWVPNSFYDSIDTNNKPLNKKIMETTNKVIKAIKDLGLSNEEKLLRKHGMHDEEGDLTEEGCDALKLLEAKERGFESWPEFCTKNYCKEGLSVLEVTDLREKHKEALLATVKKLEAEDKKKK